MFSGLLMTVNFPLAIGFEWEGLLPIVLFLLYGVSQLLSSRKKNDVDVEETAEMREEHEAEEERARQIREEIQRRVQQQRSQADATKAASEQAAAAAKRAEPVKRWTRQESHATAARNASMEPQSVVPAAKPAVKGLEVRLMEQRQKLASAKRAKSNAEREARSMANSQLRSNRYKAATTAAMDPNLVSKEIRAILSNPSSARQGILLSEILGPPVANRNFSSERNP